MKKQTYFVKGMHCKSCEFIIESTIKAIPSVDSVKASLEKGEVIINYKNSSPSLKLLNEKLQGNGYLFSEEREIKNNSDFLPKALLFIILGIIVFELIYLVTPKLSVVININSSSSLIAIFLFGVLASLSTCAALVGGIVLSLSKQWSKIGQWQPQVMFHIGRLLSFTVLGGVVGFMGQKIQLSPSVASILVILVSIVMIILGLQMVGINYFNRFQLSLPKSVIGRSINKTPPVVGAATFFLPCGFTLTAQSLSLLSGNFIKGSSIMLVFALGTLPMLFLIGFYSVKLFQNPKLSKIFSVTAGILVLLLALFNINLQFNVLGLSSFNSVTNNASIKKNDDSNLAPVINGKQVLKMEASSRGYNPDYFKVKVNKPVRFEITDTGTSGCTNAVISPQLFKGQIDLVPGKVSIKEFTPTTTGIYKFSCWMGMIVGTIEVID